MPVLLDFYYLYFNDSVFSLNSFQTIYITMVNGRLESIVINRGSPPPQKNILLLAKASEPNACFHFIGKRDQQEFLKAYNHQTEPFFLMLAVGQKREYIFVQDPTLLNSGFGEPPQILLTVTGETRVRQEEILKEAMSVQVIKEGDQIFQCLLGPIKLSTN